MLGATVVAVANQTQTITASRQQSWIAWFMGQASANPFHWEEGVCGEEVDGAFFMAPGITGQEVERTCTIPAGLEIVISNIGAFSNTPTDGTGGTKLFREALNYFEGAVPKSVTATVDGTLVPKDPATCTDPVDVALEPGSFLRETDDQAGASSTVVLCGWFYVLAPPSPGEHTMEFTGRFARSERFTLTLHLTVA
jgi:hypothetical protein